ncbi:MAG: hypothetical protein M3Q17_07075 [Actinomycetota bacterium]|nr:hypothetical protein [Actinomycetota bacterium]
MEWVWLALLAFLVIAAVRATRNRQLQARRRDELSSAQVASVKRAADEDVTVFGEELQALDIELAGSDLDAGTRADYQRALDTYEAAKESAGAITATEDVRHVSEILEDGRYATACVRARVADEPLPQRLAPCFFNPQHGPSVNVVEWAPAGGAPRDVPACALDAERVRSGAEPDSRKVMVGPQRVPYWQAGPAFAPYAAGYFATFGLMEMMFIGTMMGGVFGGWGDGGYDSGYGEGYDSGYDAGQDAGGDGGGYDSGGGGGYDSGGGGGFDGGGMGGFDGGGF